MGLRPVLINPRTLVRTWGTRTEWVGEEEWMTTPRFILPWAGKADGELYWEPHTWSLPAARSLRRGQETVAVSHISPKTSEIWGPLIG